MREIGPDEAHRLYECLEALAEHHNRVSVYFKGRYPLTPSKDRIRAFERELQEGRSFIAAVEKDGQITGFCKIGADGGKGVLEYLVVLPQERGKGHGAALMEWALGRFRALGVREIEVKTVYGNDAVQLYRKYGFREKSILLAREEKDVPGEEITG